MFVCSVVSQTKYDDVIVQNRASGGPTRSGPSLSRQESARAAALQTERERHWQTAKDLGTQIEGEADR